ncbi:MAG: ribosome silencing factor [Paludibacteraceae bacterium]|nr:ribosome silencing factor [Paludibacteraceae bacterium]
MKLIDKIVEAIQNKKGQNITVIDMRKLDVKPCDWFVVAEGGSNTQVTAIADEVEDFVRKETREKPLAYVGRDNAQWIALDYGDAIVHIFQREARQFYDIETLWADGKITEIANI